MTAAPGGAAVVEIRRRGSGGAEEVVARVAPGPSGRAEVQAGDRRWGATVAALIGRGVAGAGGPLVGPGDGPQFLAALPAALSGSRLYAVTAPAPFDAAGRAALLAVRADAVSAAAAGLPWWPERLAALDHEYGWRLPVVAVARCPHTFAVVAVAVDTFGSDGPWWSPDQPVRGPAGPLPPSFWGLVGQAADEPPTLPLRGLAHPDVTTVLSAVEVGRAWRWVAVLCGKPRPPGPAPVGDWASPSGPARTPDGGGGWAWAPPDPRGGGEPVTAIGSWLRRRRLRWVEPGDPELRLRVDIEGCPWT